MRKALKAARIIQIRDERLQFHFREYPRAGLLLIAPGTVQQLHRRRLDYRPVNPKAEHLREYAGHPIGHDRRAVGDFVQELDDFAGLNRTGVAASPARQHVRIQDALHILGAATLALDVTRHELPRQLLDRML